MLFKKIIKNEKGISLVALVVTIIVMLILAGATIKLVVGKDGILKQISKGEAIRNEQIAQEGNKTNELINQAEEEIKNVWKDSSKANPPKLSDEMVPVKWNEEKQAWVVTSNKDSEWFDYSQKKWANVMLRDGLEVEDITDASTESLENMYGKIVTKIGSMFVWIPRYAYQIESGYNSNQTGKINIDFMVGTTNMSVSGRTNWNNRSGQGNWNVHPAFEYNGTVEGIWVAKFEASSVEGNSNSSGDNVVNKTLQVKPGVQSWRYISVGNAYTVCLNYKSNCRSHLMKSTEWGAITYLAQSTYGKNDVIWSNTNSNYITGKASTSAYGADANYNYDDSTYGVQASTTGNIYGVYDMAGGAWEELAAYIDNEEGRENLNNYGSSLINAPSYAKDVYSASAEDNRVNNYQANSNRYGDAIWETSNNGEGSSLWYNSYMDFLHTTSPFLYRGGSYGHVPSIYSLGANTGYAGDSRHGFRVVLAVQ